jgi:hypothetical protein
MEQDNSRIAKATPFEGEEDRLAFVCSFDGSGDFALFPDLADFDSRAATVFLSYEPLVTPESQQPHCYYLDRRFEDDELSVGS